MAWILEQWGPHCFCLLSSILTLSRMSILTLLTGVKRALLGSWISIFTAV